MHVQLSQLNLAHILHTIYVMSKYAAANVAQQPIKILYTREGCTVLSPWCIYAINEQMLLEALEPSYIERNVSYKSMEKIIH